MTAVYIRQCFHAMVGREEGHPSWRNQNRTKGSVLGPGLPGVS